MEQGVRYMRRNLLVHYLSFNDFDKYNLELLDKSKQLMKREHYVLKQPIIDLHFEDITELNPLSPTPFDASSVSSGKLDNYGRLTTKIDITIIWILHLLMNVSKLNTYQIS